jgi:hypothetical protein
MQQPVMPGTEQNRIVEAGFSAVRPMHHVMSI